MERSAKLAGVVVNTIKNWRVRGEAALSMPASKRDAFDVKCLEFLVALDKIDNEWIRRCEVILSLTMTPGKSEAAWKAATQAERNEAAATAKWKLSHQAPDEYSTQSRTEISGADGGPLEIDSTGMDVFNILLKAKAYEDDLALEAGVFDG